MLFSTPLRALNYNVHHLCVLLSCVVPHTQGKKAVLSPQDAAAVRIQALVRGMLLRSDWAREDAAILMQAVYRGYRARVLLSDMIEQLIKQGEIG